jgi:tetratricopeptide (TPR) repeat protein
MTSSTKAAASASFKKRDYEAAIPLYEACLMDAKTTHGDFSLEVFSSMDKLAICYSETKEHDKAIRVNEERFQKMTLSYGDSYSVTLSALHSLAHDYFNRGDFGKALSLYEDCFNKRRLALGASHESTLESKAVVYALRTRLFNRMKAKELIELIDRRKLSRNRNGLCEKKELLQLLESNIPKVERRGVTVKLLQEIRKLALHRRNDASYWTIARISALINGNHEIIEPNCRYGYVDPYSTLTFAERCSFIDVLLSNHFDINNKHPLLNLSYKEAVGEKASLFVSFAYLDNYIELVDALELHIETQNLPEISTYFWFDIFVNDQWTAVDKDFDWWANAFRETVTTIGHTLTFLSPWSNPSYLKRVWCLLEMRYSPRVTLILSRKEVKALQDGICSVFGTFECARQRIIKSLCQISVEDASSFRPEDRERIFEVIRSMEGGVDGFNNAVMVLIRNWISDSAKLLIKDVIDADLSRKLSNLDVGSLDAMQDVAYLHNYAYLQQTVHGKLDEAKAIFERILKIEEKSLGPHHLSTMITRHSLGFVLSDLGKHEEAIFNYKRVLKVFDKKLGPKHERTLKTVNSLGVSLCVLKRYEEAELMLERASKSREETLGPDHMDTLRSISCLGSLLDKMGRETEAMQMHEKAWKGYSKTLGENHPDTLLCLNNVAMLSDRQGKHTDAKEMSDKALKGYMKALGEDHPTTLVCILNNATLLLSQGKYKESRAKAEQALKGQEKLYGLEDERTLLAVRLLMQINHEQNRFDSNPASYEELERLLKRVLRIHEKNRGPENILTITAAVNLGDTLNQLGQRLEKVEKFEEARLLLERVLKTCDRALETDAGIANIANAAANNLGSVLKQLGMCAELRGEVFKMKSYFKDSQLYFERALKGFEIANGRDHALNINTVFNLGQVHMLNKNYDQARDLYERALKSREKTLGKDNPQTLSCLSDLAVVMMSQGNLKDAEPLLQRAYEGYRSQLGESHPITIDTKETLEKMSDPNLTLFLQNKFA